MRAPRRFGFLPLLLWLAACDATEPRFSEVAGIYGLVLPESGALSLRIDARSTVPVEVRSGKLDLQPIWRFNLDYATDAANGGGSGTYERTETGVILSHTGGGVEVGTFEGDDLVITTRFGEVVRFRKVPEAQ